MIAVLVSDLHLTDKAEDKYRWRVFEQVQEIVDFQGAEYVFILGDLTDAKDYHSSRLVNMVVGCLWHLFKSCETLKGIFILRGNHDGLDPDTPYFLFLSAIPNLRFVQAPLDITLGASDGVRRFLLLPHSRDPENDWREIIEAQRANADYIFFHATLDGSLSENGMPLRGVSPSIFEGCRGVLLAGDVHVPSDIYIGAPYHVHFGDKFHPRAVVLKAKGRQDNLIDVPLENIRKHMITLTEAEELSKHDIRRGDQLKVRIELTKAQFVDWQKIKAEVIAYCKEQRFELHGIELLRRERPRIKSIHAPRTESDQLHPLRVLADYCVQQNLDEFVAEVGKELLDQ